MRYYYGVVLVSLGIVVMVLDPFNKLDVYLRESGHGRSTLGHAGLAPLRVEPGSFIGHRKGTRWSRRG